MEELDQYTIEEIRAYLIENDNAVNYSFLTSLFSKAGQRMQYYCLCDLFGYSHLTPKEEIISQLSEYFSKIK